MFRKIRLGTRGYPSIVVIDGVIGAGKSTWIEHIADALKILNIKTITIPEPVDEWKKTNILQDFYANKKMNAFKFQIFVLYSCVKKLNEGIDEALRTGARLVLVERSIYSHRLFANVLHEEKNMSDLEYDTYEFVWKAIEKSIRIHPTHFVYLNHDMLTCMSRIRQRGRKCELKQVTEEYQNKLINAHNAHLLSSQGIKVGGNYIKVIPFTDDVTTRQLAIRAICKLFDLWS
jgi:deoxyadenosine/deoxycytidine kinase